MLVIGNAHALECYPAVLALLDEEFVYSKGRSISLSKRMPCAYAEQNAKNIYCAMSDHRLIGVVVTRRFETQVANEWITGYMIGGVVTRNEYRGQGVASQLLSHMENTIKDASFFILWTGIPGFYKRLGWRDGVCGVFGRFQSPGGEKEQTDQRIVSYLLTPENMKKIDKLRTQSKLAVLRECNDDRCVTIPLPAEKADILLAMNESNEPEAYAAIGIKADTVFIYELAGEFSAMHNILDHLRNTHATVFLNADEISRKSFPDMDVFDVKPGSSALIKSLSPALPTQIFEELYISYLDRI